MLKAKKILKRTIAKYGKKHQKLKAVEEMAELTVEIAHDVDGRKHNAEEEIADVLITIHQLMLIYDSDNIQKAYTKKLKRLSKRVM